MPLQPTVTRTRVGEYAQRGARRRLNAGRLAPIASSTHPYYETHHQTTDFLYWRWLRPARVGRPSRRGGVRHRGRFGRSRHALPWVPTSG
jgi:hypothetical protein